MRRTCGYPRYTASVATRKVLLSLDQRVVSRIDRAAKRRGLTRSAYVEQLAVADLASEKGPGADPSVRAALASVDDLFERNPVPAEDLTLVIRRMRDER